MRVLDLFSGIGGLSLGLEWAGMTTVAFCEIDNDCRERLRQHWPDVPIHEDIRSLQGDEYGAVDVVCGGYPCQPFSIAGSQRGEEDERHLWPEMLRVIQRAKPEWVICENVYGHVKRGSDTVLSQLEAEGYTCWPLVFPASAVAAPHDRRRLFIIAHAKHYGRPTLPEQGSNGKNVRGTTGRPDSALQSEGIHQPGNVADTSGAGLQKPDTAPKSDRPGQPPRRAFAGWLLGRPEPSICRVDNGLSGELDEAQRDEKRQRASRIKMLGNAVVPQVAYIIGLTIMRYMEAIYGQKKS